MGVDGESKASVPWEPTGRPSTTTQLCQGPQQVGGEDWLRKEQSPV